MKQLPRTTRGLALAATAVLLLAAPALAQDIPAGDDTWATTSDGTTRIWLDNTDWAAFCNGSGDPVQVHFKGIALSGQGDGSVVVERLQAADLTSSNVAYVPVRVKALGFASVTTYSTPCGNLNFRVDLTRSQQTATMEIRKEASWGGHFFVDLPVSAVLRAIHPSTGAQVGASVLKEGTLEEPSGGTVWSYNPPPNPLDPNAPWHPGVNQSGQRVTISRSHQQILADHAYKPVTYCGGVVIGTQAVASPSPSPTPCPAEPVAYD